MFVPILFRFSCLLKQQIICPVFLAHCHLKVTPLSNCSPESGTADSQDCFSSEMPHRAYEYVIENVGPFPVRDRMRDGNTLLLRRVRVRFPYIAVIKSCAIIKICWNRCCRSLITFLYTSIGQCKFSKMYTDERGQFFPLVYTTYTWKRILKIIKFLSDS